MKARVVRAYVDKESKKSHKVGETVELSDVRFKMLKDNGFVVEDLMSQKVEIEELKKENTSLKAKVKELSAIIEKAAKP